MDAAPRTASRLYEVTLRYRHDGNLHAYGAELEHYWPIARLVELMRSPRREVARSAVQALGVVGGMPHSQAVAHGLHYPDPLVADDAENSLWNIWFRAGGTAAQSRLQSHMQQAGDGHVSAAIHGLTDLIRHFPVFAELYNQRATAHMLAGNPLMARHDYARAARSNPHHFAAFAGLGHCLLLIGEYAGALRAYLRARCIHPRLEGVRQSIRRIREILSSDESRPASPVHRMGPYGQADSASNAAVPQLRLAEFDAAGSIARK